jgi:hypothetical protein
MTLKSSPGLKLGELRTSICHDLLSQAIRVGVSIGFGHWGDVLNEKRNDKVFNFPLAFAKAVH